MGILLSPLLLFLPIYLIICTVLYIISFRHIKPKHCLSPLSTLWLKLWRWKIIEKESWKTKFKRIMMPLIILFYAHFWIFLGISHFQPFERMVQTEDFDFICRIYYDTQNFFDRIMTGGEGKLFFQHFIFDRLENYPIRYLWYWACGPYGLFFFIYFLIPWKPKEHPLQWQLDRYKVDLPKKINFEKIKKTAIKLGKKYRVKFTFLGYNATGECPAVVKDEERIRQVQIIGSTGSGKTSLILSMIEQDIARRRGVIFIDAKGDLSTAKTLYKMAKDLGREKDFLMFSTNNPEKSHTYNPLLLGNSTQLKDKVIGTMHFTEPYYKRECENGLQILFSEYLAKHDKITLPELNEILKNPPGDMPEFRDFFDEHKRNITGIQSEISLMAKTPFGHLFNGEEINLLEIYQQRKIVYFTINVMTYGEMGHRLGRFITGDINTLAGLRMDMESRERQELAIYIDEYGYFGTPKFAYTLAQGRSAGLMITIAHQSIDDLKGISNEHPGQIRTNTNTKIVLRVNDPMTAGEFADELGTYRTVEQTRQIGGTGPEMGSEKVVDAYKVHPQQIKDLQLGQAYYKTPSEWGFLLLKQPEKDIRGISLPDREKPKETQIKGPGKDIKEPLDGPPGSMFEV